MKTQEQTPRQGLHGGRAWKEKVLAEECCHGLLQHGSWGAIVHLVLSPHVADEEIKAEEGGRSLSCTHPHPQLSPLVGGGVVYIFSLAAPQLWVRPGRGDQPRETWKRSPGEAGSTRLGLTRASHEPLGPCPPACPLCSNPPGSPCLCPSPSAQLSGHPDRRPGALGQEEAGEREHWQ